MVFSELTDGDRDPYLNRRKAMFLAGALNVRYGCEIQITLDSTPGAPRGAKLSYEAASDLLKKLEVTAKAGGAIWLPYIVHAWVVVAASGKCLDIGGIYHPSLNQWSEERGDCLDVIGLDIHKLKEIAMAQGGKLRPTLQEWDADLAEATKLVIKNELDLDKIFPPQIRLRPKPR